MNRTLIVYHSRSGNTRRIALALARRLHADLDEIRIVQHLGGAIGYAMCALESMAGLTPALRPSHRDPSRYDLVVIGTPVWFWNVSSPVRSWLEAHPLTHRVAFFCTMGGSGGRRAFATMAEIVAREPVATLALPERAIGAADVELGAFVRQLRGNPPRSAARRTAHRHALHAA